MPGQNSKPPIAFLSYAHRDDQQTAGKITQLREALQLAVSSVVGRDFEIFQDTDAIAWGRHWQGRLDEALGQAQFLIPIVTPSYFSSKPCRDELEKFIQLERKARRSDLILPLYFRTVRDFNSSDDPLVQLISRRQFRDWREVRNRRLDDPEIQEQIDNLADELGEAIANSPEGLTRPEPSRPEVEAARSAPAVSAEPAAVADQLTQLYARLDRFERELARRDEEISGLRSARTTLQEELAEARQTPKRGPMPNIRQSGEAGARIRLLTAASGLVGLVIGGAGVWMATESGGDALQQSEMDQLTAQLSEAREQLETRQNAMVGLEEELQQRQTEIESLELRASEAEATAAELEDRVAAERREKDELQRQLTEARASGQAAIVPATGPDQPWREPGCDDCPWMISLPGGTFTMGSPENEEGGSSDEGPQREVTVQPFAIGQYEVTFDEWEACVEGGGCSHKPDDEGWGRGNRPVINVSWNDAQQYVEWLKDQTGEPYRLPSEAEWEYATRAGTKTPYWWDGEIPSRNANYGGTVGKTTEVGRYPPNPWGLHDTAGNVWEWVEDCWNDSYEGAPKVGSAWLQGNCSRRVVRGGSWGDQPGSLRSGNRNWFGPGFRSSYLGFRVSRMLTP